jgi:hypothetical protein
MKNIKNTEKKWSKFIICKSQHKYKFQWEI